MKRWALWFPIPVILVFSIRIPEGGESITFNFLPGLTLWFWIGITFIAVPFAILFWIVKGQHRKDGCS